MKQWTGSKLGKEYVKAVYCHHAYLKYKQSASFKIPGLDEAQAGFNIDGRNINNLRYADDTILMAQSKEELKSLLMKVKEKSEKSDLKLTFKTLRPWHSVPSLHGKQMGEKMETVADFIFLGSKITADGHCSHEIKTCSLEEKLWLT